MTIAVAESWLEPLLRRFVDDARVALALVLHPSGQVLGQHGFTRKLDVMSACALAAAINASSGELGRQLEGKPFRGLHHAGVDKQLFLGCADSPNGQFLLLTVFDQASSLGLVQLYFSEFAAEVSRVAPDRESRGPVLADNFERDLNRNLASLFGRA